MARSARISRARHSTSFTVRIGATLGLVVMILGCWLLLFKPQKPDQEAKGGRLIVGKAPSPPESREQSQKEELTFYRTLTDKGDKAPSSVNFQSTKVVQSQSKMNPGRSSEAKSIQMNSPSTKRYALQVGSFVEKNSADRLVAKLVGKGYPAYLVKTHLDAQDVRYRVRVGFFRDKAHARVLAERLEKEEGLKSFIAFAEQGP